MSSLFLIISIILPGICTFVWKRQMIQGGSSIWTDVKQYKMKRKRRQRQRLRDILNDDLLRKQMKKDFLSSKKEGCTTSEQCDAKIQELQNLASQSVTPDDIHVSLGDVLEQIMWRIWIGFGVWLVLLIWCWSYLFYIHIAILLLWIALHEIDNRINFRIISTTPRMTDDSNDDMIHVI